MLNQKKKYQQIGEEDKIVIVADQSLIIYINIYCL